MLEVLLLGMDVRNVSSDVSFTSKYSTLVLGSWLDLCCAGDEVLGIGISCSVRFGVVQIHC